MARAEARPAASTSTSVLPMSTAPISFSGDPSRRVTSLALALPSWSSAWMRAREAAVRPVSLMLKKALMAISKMIAAIRSPISRVMGFTRGWPAAAILGARARYSKRVLTRALIDSVLVLGRALPRAFTLPLTGRVALHAEGLKRGVG